MIVTISLSLNEIISVTNEKMLNESISVCMNEIVMFNEIKFSLCE
jgi:hypothetical protein